MADKRKAGRTKPAKEKIKGQVKDRRPTEKAGLSRVGDDDSFLKSGHETKKEEVFRVRERTELARQIYNAKQHFSPTFAHELAPVDDNLGPLQEPKTPNRKYINTAPFDPRYAWLNESTSLDDSPIEFDDSPDYSDDDISGLLATIGKDDPWSQCHADSAHLITREGFYKKHTPMRSAQAIRLSIPSHLTQLPLNVQIDYLVKRAMQT